MSREGQDVRNVIAVIVNYNSGDWLRASVAALLESTQTLRLFVVDNASSDGSIDSLDAQYSSAANVRVVRNTANVGFSRANNQVITKESADIYVLVNPDCIVQPDTIETIISAIDEDETIGLASCLVKNPDGSVQKTCRREFPTPWSGLIRLLGLNKLSPRIFPDFDTGQSVGSKGIEYVDAVSGAFLVARASALKEVGYLDESYFMHCEDLDWCMRFSQHGYKVAFVPTTTVMHVKGGSGRSLRVNWHLHRGILRFYKKFYISDYPILLLPLIYIGVFASFSFKSLVILIRGQEV